MVLDRDGRYLLAAGTALTENGYDPAAIEGRLATEVIPPERWAFYEPMFAAALAGESSSCPLRTEDEMRAYHVEVTPLLDEAGEVVAVSILTQETTEQLDAERRVARAESDFQQVFDCAPVGMAIVDLAGRILRANAALAEITGYTTEELCVPVDELVHPEDLARDREHLRQLADGAITEFQVDRRIYNVHGHVVWVALGASVMHDEDGLPSQLVVQVTDISSRKLAEARLRKLADYDPLTRVFNRRRFEQDLGFQIRRTRRYAENAALLVVDVEELKQINDGYGHEVGDSVLRAVAKTLRKRARQADTVARLGDDEFGLLLIHIEPDQVEAVAAELHRLVRDVSVPLPGGCALSCAVRVGYAVLDAATTDEAELLAAARRTMASDPTGGDPAHVA